MTRRPPLAPRANVCKSPHLHLSPATERHLLNNYACACMTLTNYSYSCACITILEAEELGEYDTPYDVAKHFAAMQLRVSNEATQQLHEENVDHSVVEKFNFAALQLRVHKDWLRDHD